MQHYFLTSMVASQPFQMYIFMKSWTHLTQPGRNNNIGINVSNWQPTDKQLTSISQNRKNGNNLMLNQLNNMIKVKKKTTHHKELSLLISVTVFINL